ncbi:MFS transporter [Agrobacterium rosae]|uniref:Inner membrane transport protein YnfM n=1 Tax=Agrobacterium rosae TaxID=1972867 RepID=A0A1R3U2X1_9HYPH|nr:MFS transporter [Agrobacterium rosae]SCX35799.1 Inner membrane transport protein YnfM [Agrobacterium rosae]
MGTLSSTQRTPKDSLHVSESISAGLTFLFALSVGVVVLSLYSSQPLIGLIGSTFGLSAGEAGLVSTLTLLGYASGLFLLVPLTDLLENKTVIISTLIVDIVSLAAIAVAPTPVLFLLACYAVGVSASAIQMLVPVAAQLSPEAHRGRVVGNVMSGLMLGILLSRPAASLVAEFTDWRWFYGGLAVMVGILTVILSFVLPRRRPQISAGYWRLIGSMFTILREETVLQRRAIYQGLCMGAFGVYWTAIALLLSSPPFSLGQTGIALFALAGAAGAVIAPIAGRVGDRGWTRRATQLAHFAVIGAMVLAAIGGHAFIYASTIPVGISLAVLVGSAILLDLGVIGDQTLGRRAINLLRPEARGRVNGLFTGLFFLGAAAGSAISGFAWVTFGWLGICFAGAAFGCTALMLSLTEPRLHA